MTSTFINSCAQGDVFFEKVDAIPEEAIAENAFSGEVIVTHSETGHHHVMDAQTTTMYRLPQNIYELFLDVKEPTDLIHKRAHDTHRPIRFEPGKYRVRRQREYTPEGYRRVED